jgi:hypothetical protein
MFWYLLLSAGYLLMIAVLLLFVASASRKREAEDRKAHEFFRSQEQRQRYRDAA